MPPESLSPAVTGADARDILIAAAGIGVQRSGRWLVKDVDLSVRRGEIVTVIGPNGSGKSTMAKALLGLEAPSEGRVDRRPDLRVGYVPQALALDRTMPLTVRRLMRLVGRHSDRAVDRALSRVGIAHLAAAQPQTLSGGEFQRLLLARAILRRPDLMVLDEPVQGVDFAGEVALYDLIGRIRDELGCGILLISHDLHIVMAKTDTVICLNTHVCCHGPPGSVTGHPEYRRLFGDRAADTLAVYRHRHDHVHQPDGSVVVLGDGPGSDPGDGPRDASGARSGDGCGHAR